MSSTVPPRKRPGAPETKPPPDDFDEEAPTSVAPGKVRVDMPHEFDPGGVLDDSDDSDDNDVTSVSRDPKAPGKVPAAHPPVRHDDDDDTAPTKDS
jgi:hypothetical protein